MLLSAKEIISRSLETFQRDIRLFLPYILLTFVLSLLSIIFTVGTTLWGFLLASGFSLVVVFIVTLIILLAVLLLSMLVNIALVRVVRKRLYDQPLDSLKQEVSGSSHLLGRSIGVSLLVGLLAALPVIVSLVGYSVFLFFTLSFQTAISSGGALALMIALFVLGVYGIFHMIYFSLKFAFSYYAVVLDNKHIRESLHVSGSLVKGRMLSVFWRLFAPVSVFILIYLLVNYILTALATLIGGDIAFLVANVVSLFVSAFISPLTVLATVIVYENLLKNPIAPKIEKVNDPQ